MKFYAVKEGHKTGIFDTWTECEKQVKGYSGAKYKSFGRKEDAEEYLGLGKPKSHDGNFAYVDGSFNGKEYGCGILLMIDNKKITHSFKGSEEDFLPLQNVGGEIKAAMYVMEYCKKNNIKEITLHYDYEGIEKWCTREWQAKTKGTKAYRDFYNNIEIKINFVWIKGHSGNKYNEEVDQLAKQSLK